MEEVWKGIYYQGIDYSDRLEVSNRGRIRNAINKKEYKLNKVKTGYYQATISLGSRKNKKAFRIHRVVAENFIENKFNLPEVNHIDGNKENNDVSNLEWCTKSDNQKHAYRIGLHISVKKEKQGSAKLTNNDVEYIRTNYKPKHKEYGCRALARRFGVHHKTIEEVINNKTWRG